MAVYRNEQIDSAFQMLQYLTVIITKMEEEHQDSNHSQASIEDSSDNNNFIQMQDQALQEQNTNQNDEPYYNNIQKGNGSPQDQEYIQHERKFKKINRKYMLNRDIFRISYPQQKNRERLQIQSQNYDVQQRLQSLNQNYDLEYFIRLRHIIEFSEQFERVVQGQDQRVEVELKEEHEDQNEEQEEEVEAGKGELDVKVDQTEEDQEQGQEDDELDLNGRVYQTKQQICSFIKQQLDDCNNPHYLYELYKIIKNFILGNSHHYFYIKITEDDQLMIRVINRMFEFPFSVIRQQSLYVVNHFIGEGRPKIINFMLQSRLLTKAFQTIDTTKLNNLYLVGSTAQYLLNQLNELIEEEEEQREYGQTLHDQDVFTVMSIIEEQVGKLDSHIQILMHLPPFVEYWKNHLTQQFVQLQKARINAFVDKLKPIKQYYLVFVNLILRKIGYFITNNEQLLDQIDLWLQNEQITQMDGLVQLITQLISYNQKLTPIQWSRLKRFCLVVPAKVNELAVKRMKLPMTLAEFYENALKIRQFGQNSQLIKLAALYCFECYFSSKKSKKVRDIIQLTLLQQKGAFKAHAKDMAFWEDLQRKMKKLFKKRQLQLIKTTFGLQIKK